MSKSIVKIMSIMMMAVILIGCGNTDSKVEQIIQDQVQEAERDTNQSENAEETDLVNDSDSFEELESEETTVENRSVSASDAGIDIDLTKLSSTMVYSEVYNMMYTPEDYIGKTVKMSGMFVAYTNQDGSKYYPAVIITDATACCSQGFEFILEGNPSYPEGYPEMETEITVVGVFETYEEDGDSYCRLQNAKLQ